MFASDTLNSIDAVCINNSRLFKELEEITNLRRLATTSEERLELDLKKIKIRKQVDNGIDQFLKLYAEK